MSCNQFGVSTEQSLTEKCFVEFIAFTIRMLMQYKLQYLKNKGNNVPHNSFKRVLDELNGIQEIEFTSGYIAVKPVSKVQQDCLSMFRVNTPSDRYDNNLAFSNCLKKALKPH